MKFVAFLIAFLLSLGSFLSAREPYHAVVTVDTTTVTVSAPNLKDLKNDLRTTALEELIPFYTPVSPVSIGIDFRGIDVEASFAADSTVLVVNIPQAGISRTFDGGTRDNSIALFKEAIQDGGGDINLLKAYARFSPIDPIAGNPNSLMAQMGQADYLVGHLSPLAGCDECWCAQPIVHQFQAGLYSGRAFCHRFDTTTLTLPLRYSYSPDLSWAFIIDLPLTYNRNGGASSIFTSVGLGLRYPVTCDWSLTPVFRLGSGGSVDLCTAGAFISTGLTSVYNYNYREFVFSLTNYVAYISSINLWLGGDNLNYHLHNYVFKNGLAITSCNGYCFCKRPVYVSVSFLDTAFTREKLFIKHYDEVGISLITNGVLPCVDYDCLILGFSYQWGQKGYKAYFLNLAYQF
ncbi:MAG: hypothetical protein LLG04_05115 [Parachlamydia sp.]|nr:hypothetical protein [Parachlamydia sp.]